MAFRKLPIGPTGTDAQSDHTPNIDIWTVFRALRDARSLFGLRPGHIQTLQAMLSFLKPGQGETVFASNHSICERVGGIDERTLRRHIGRFVELGLLARNDSSNRKRYRVRSSGGECISFGLSISPLLKRAQELIALSERMEQERQDKIFIRKKILTKLAAIEQDNPENPFLQEARKTLRRKLSVLEYQALLAKTDAQFQLLNNPLETPKSTNLPANDGQTVRHISESNKEEKDLDIKSDNVLPSPELLTATCDQAMSFTRKKLRSWNDVKSHAYALAPMMGIRRESFERAVDAIGSKRASCAIFIMLQIGKEIRDYGAYFHSITQGRQRHRFDPATIVVRMSNNSIA